MQIRTLAALILPVLVVACGGTEPADSSTRPSPSVVDPTGQGGGAGGPAGLAAPPAQLRAPRLPDAPAPSPAAHPHRRCGWIGAGDQSGAATFVAHADWYDAVHPDWFALNADGITLRPILGHDDPALLAAAKAKGVLVIPMIAAVENAAYIRGTLGDAARRSAHVAAIVSLVQSKGYDGVDLDYEHLWKSSDRPGMTALLTELAAALHAAGKQVSVAVPPLDNANPNSAWDLAAISAIVDTLHIMGYDLHTLGTHEGPVAPLGWIDAVAAFAEKTGHPDRFVLGLPNYGVTSSWFAPTKDAIAICGGAGKYATTTAHMDGCSYGQWAAGRAPHCDTPHGVLYFEDLGSLDEKVAVAAQHHLGGITYWTIGSEPDGFFEMVTTHYAK